jgi:hypothetical protein
VHALPTFGCTFFSVERRPDNAGTSLASLLSSHALLPGADQRYAGGGGALLLGLSETRLTLLEPRNKKVLLAYPLAQVARWSVLHSTLSLWFVGASRPDTFETRAAATISEVLSTYVWLLLLCLFIVVISHVDTLDIFIMRCWQELVVVRRLGLVDCRKSVDLGIFIVLSS